MEWSKETDGYHTQLSKHVTKYLILPPCIEPNRYIILISLHLTLFYIVYNQLIFSKRDIKMHTDPVDQLQVVKTNLLIFSGGITNILGSAN